MIDFRVVFDPTIVANLEKVEHLDRTFREGGFNERVGRRLLTEEVRPYPPPTPTYDRTFRLFNSWQLELPHGDTLFSIESAEPPYNVYVQQRATQAWMHRNRWQTVEDVAEQKEEWVAAEAVAFLEGTFE